MSFMRGYDTNYGIVVYAPDLDWREVNSWASEYGIKDGQGMSVVQEVDMGWFNVRRPSFDGDMEDFVEHLVQNGYEVFPADRNGNQR